MDGWSKDNMRARYKESKEGIMEGRKNQWDEGQIQVDRYDQKGQHCE